MTRIERLQRHGILRRGSPRGGFRHVRADGGVLDAGDLERIRALVIPPAWDDVAIAAARRAAIQAVGRDAAGRWQYGSGRAAQDERGPRGDPGRSRGCIAG